MGSTLPPLYRDKKAVELRNICKPVEGGSMSHPSVCCLRSIETNWDEETLC